MTEEEMERMVKEILDQAMKEPPFRYKGHFDFEPTQVVLEKLAELPLLEGDVFSFSYVKKEDNTLYLYEEEYVYGVGYFHELNKRKTEINNE